MECLQILNSFADDMSLFLVVHNSGLTVISNWDFQWKSNFNPDLTKQAQVVIFSRKTKKLLDPSRSFNYIPLRNSISPNISG